ncbi:MULTISPECIES: VIT1/CCC1 transporter family protein [unclassified Archaeoglobus]|jgi:predicted membrane protein (TIGR00267 family)|uniref:VIT1/CCC1 transporter family protein n=1 Tax=unclassified Archaeoglobus TaxID=2643606 RepID=UPI0025C1266D|nr:MULTISPECIES: VIT1/CCC1 transporter family protein [unclassified Archaeoglobus]
MRDRIKKFKGELELYSRMTDIASVSRRYFVIGFFDGVLTILGMIIGAHMAGEASSRLILSAGVATALALGISSSWGAFEAERIEQKIMKDRKERALLINSKECSIDRAHRFAAYVSSIIHGVAPIVAAFIPLLPYVFLPIEEAFTVAVSLGFASLFVVGSIMGRVAKFNIVLSGLRMLLAGIFTALLVTILSPSHFI